MSSLLIVGVDAKVFLIASADPCQANIITAPLIGLLLSIVNWILFFVGSPIRRSPPH
jgi:hypothetical protein